MLQVALYGPNPEENWNACRIFSCHLRSIGISPVFQEFTGDRERFLTYIRNNPYLIIVVLQPGPKGAETVQLAKAANPYACIVWFSDHDYALFAFGLHLTYFNLLPADCEKVGKAIEACRTSRRHEPWDTALSLAQSTRFPQIHIMPFNACTGRFFNAFFPFSQLRTGCTFPKTKQLEEDMI